MFENIHASEKRVSINYSKSIKTIEDLLKHTILNKETGCREWIHGKGEYGYGRATYQGKPIDVHRWAWILTHPNQILTKKDLICHTCDNPPCCEPYHLFLGTILTNNQDSKAKGRRMHQKMTHCVNGHLRTKENTYNMKRPDGRERVECRICSIISYNRRHNGIELILNDLGEWENVT